VQIEGFGLKGVSSVIVGATGIIQGTDQHSVAYGISSQHSTNITNAGYIYGYSAAIQILGTTTAFTIKNTGTIEGDDDFGQSMNLYGSGKHKVTNSGDIKSMIQNYGGSLNLTNEATGHVTGTILGVSLVALSSDESKDTVTNKGSIYGSMYFGSGADVFTNAGTVTGNVNLGADNDSFTNKGQLYGTVLMGAGNDKFTSGDNQDRVSDEAGKDSYKLGGGDDRFFAVAFGNSGVASDGQVDTVDGGAGTSDQYHAIYATSRVVINLDSANRTDVLTGVIAAKSSASGLEIGLDKIKNFERAYGGAGNDLIFGSKADNQLQGGQGDDTIYGGVGSDRLLGDSGADNLIGDAGLDELWGAIMMVPSIGLSIGL
jgi:Ca2+-binding RTX toxin-like protein